MKLLLLLGLLAALEPPSAVAELTVNPNLLTECSISGACNTVTHTVGDYSFTLRKDQFKVQALNSSVTLQNPNGDQAFVSYTLTNFSVTERHGNFNHILEPIQKQSTLQSIDYIEASDHELTITGTLKPKRSPGSNPFTVYECAFSVASGPSPHLLTSCRLPSFTPDSPYPLPPPLTPVLSLAFKALDEEKFTGLGLQFSFVDLTGHTVPIHTGEQGVGRGVGELSSLMNEFLHDAGGTQYSTYSPSPLFTTSKNRGGYVNNTEYTTFQSSNKRFSYTVLSHSINAGFFISAESTESFYSLLTDATSVTGRFSPPPSWSYTKGAVVGMQGGTEAVTSKLAKLTAANVPVAGLWIQDWAGRRVDPFGSRILWNWELDSLFYPQWGNFLSELFSRGIRVLTYVNPHFATNVKTLKPHYTRNLFEEAKTRGFLVTNSSGEPYIQSSASDEFAFGTVDLTNPRANAFFKDVVIKCHMLCQCDDAHVFWPLIDRNSDEQPHDCGNGLTADVAAFGWMADFGEYLPYDVTMSDGSKGAEMHSAYPPLLADTVSSALGKENEDVLFFSRAGGLRSGFGGRNGGQFWAGDQNTEFGDDDGLLSALTAYITGGSSGFTLVHSDIGGYTSIDLEFATEPPKTIKVARTEELLLRWMEMSAFSDCMFRTHEGNQADRQLQVWSSELLSARFAFWAKFHSLLGPIRKKLFEEAATLGWPVVRGMWFDYGEHGFGIRDQYMLGKIMLVAPVTDEGAVERSVWLPSGETWINFWTCEEVEGTEEKVVVGGAIGKPPAFVRASMVGEVASVWEGLGMPVCGGGGGGVGKWFKSLLG